MRAIGRHGEGIEDECLNQHGGKQVVVGSSKALGATSKTTTKKKKKKKKRKLASTGAVAATHRLRPGPSPTTDGHLYYTLLGSCVSAPTYPHQCFHHTHTHHPELNRASSCCYGWWLDDIWLSFSGGRDVAGGLTSSSSVYFSLRLRRYSRSAKHKHQYII